MNDLNADEILASIPGFLAPYTEEAQALDEGIQKFLGRFEDAAEINRIFKIAKLSLLERWQTKWGGRPLTPEETTEAIKEISGPASILMIGCLLSDDKDWSPKQRLQTSQFFVNLFRDMHEKKADPRDEAIEVPNRSVGVPLRKVSLGD